MKFIAIKTGNGKKTGEISLFCRVLDVSTQAFYDYLKSFEKVWKYDTLVALMKEITHEDECNDTYGSMRMWEALKFKETLSNVDFPHIPSERTVYRIMVKTGLIHKPNRVPNSLTKADKEAQKSDNLIKGDFTADAPLKKAITDITELPTVDGKLYISGMFDCFDVVPIGLAMDDNMRAELCEATLINAAKTYGRIAIKGLTAHSDRGGQYTSELYRKAIAKYGIEQSMNSAAGRCHDNARCESIWARMKTELIYGRYDTTKMSMEAVKTLVWRYFMSYWTNRRICTAIGGIPPAVKRQRYYEKLAKVA